MARFAIVIVAPFVLAWTFLSVLLTEMAQAPKYAWLAVREEVESIASAWRANSLNSEDWK